MMYILFDEYGAITEHDELPDHVSWDSWPRAIKIELNAFGGHTAFELTNNGWEEILSGDE
jgi:hypothetical protein